MRERAPLGPRLKARAYGLLPLPLLGRLMPRRVLGFHYHVVSDADLPHVRHLYPYKTPTQFERDLRWLRDHFRLLTYRQLEAGAAGACVSLDDGYRECYTEVRPLLLRHGVPCTFFVTTGWLDNRRMFYRNRVSLCLDRLANGAEAAPAAAALRATGEPVDDRAGLRRWLRGLDREDERLDAVCEALGVDTAAFLREQRPYLSQAEVRALHDDGFTVGGHTVTHPILGRLGDWDEARAEIVESCRAVREITGQERVPFAFPVSGRSVDRDRLADLRREHPWIGLVFGTWRLQHDRDWVVHRIPAERPGPLDDGRSNLPHHLRRAYVNQGASVLRTPLRAVGAALTGRPARGGEP